MQNENRLVPDFRTETIEEITETYTPEGGTEQIATYKIGSAHPIIGGILDKFTWIRTHAAAVWWNALERVTLRDKITAMDEQIAQLNGKNRYSLEEACIGTWVDGKPLYQKVITQSADIFVPSSSYAKYKIAHNISNFSRANKCYICMQSGSTTYILPYFDPGNGAIGTYVHAINRENVIVCSKDNWGNYNIIIVIEYTKTTD